MAGRPSKLNKEEINKILLQNKEFIFDEELVFKFCKDDPFWNNLEKTHDAGLEGSSWYTYACSLRRELLKKNGDESLLDESTGNVTTNSNTTSNNSFFGCEQNYEISVTREEIQNLTENCVRQKTTRNGVKKVPRKRFIPEKYKCFLTDKLVETTDLPCGLMFKSAYFSVNEDYGTIEGLL